jgi:hypothetical protein
MKKLHYISANPGSGKTHWIIKRLRRNIKRRELISLYVAPSKRLLSEVEQCLPKCLRIDGSTHHTRVVFHIHSALKHAKPGDVLLITHAAFVRIKEFFQDENLEVIIDETIDLICEFNTRKLVQSLDWFLSIVDLHLPDDPTYKDYKLLKIKPEKRKEVRKYIKSSDSDSSINVDETKELLKYILDDRYRVFISGMQRKDFYLIVTLIDTSVFKRFKRAIFSSAFIESTEMFHLLDKDYIMVDATAKAKLRQIDHQYANVVIYPLFKRNRIFSKNQRDSCIVVPKEHTEVLQLNFSQDDRFCLEAFNSFKRGAIQRLKKTETKHQSLDFIAVHKVRGMLDHFYRIVKRSKIFGEDTLIVVNKDVESYKPPVGALMPAKSHGLNCYSDYTKVAFFTALNPDRYRTKFYKSVIPEYDPTNDWLINTLAQAVTRTSVRNPSNTQKVHVLVPDLTTARLLKKKLHGLPTIRIEDFAEDYNVLGVRDLLSKREREKRNRQKIEKFKNKNPNYQKEYHKQWREKNREKNRERNREYMRQYRLRKKQEAEAKRINGKK